MTRINIIPFRRRFIDPDAAPFAGVFLFLTQKQQLVRGWVAHTARHPCRNHRPLVTTSFASPQLQRWGQKSDTSRILLRKAQSAKAASGMSYWYLFI